MNYINKDKNYMTDAERIKYLEESIRELRKEKENLEMEKGEIRQRFIKLQEAQAKLIRVAENKELKEEVKKWKMVADENGEHYDMMKDEYEKLEKENKELKKELKKYKHYYDRDKEELMESCYALKKENDEMKNKMEELEQENKTMAKKLNLLTNQK